jgi:mannose-6-phosphate isomerase-like protein (cupin superfamily)
MSDSLIDLNQMLEFLPDRVVKKDLMSAEFFNMALICLDTGQQIPPHLEGCDAVFYVLRGEGVITIGKEEYSVSEGSLVFSPKRESRGIRSVKRLSLLGIRENVTEKSSG